MSIVIRVKTLKALAGFLGVCLFFAGGYQLKDHFNPQTAMRHVYVAKADPEVIGTPDMPTAAEVITGAKTGQTDQINQSDTAGLNLFDRSADTSPQAPDSVSSDNKSSDLADYRLNRALARSQELALLEDVAKDAEASEAERQKARADRLAKVRQIETEVECEGALTAKGFQDVLVTIRDQQVTILMSTDVLETEELLQISDVICRITNCSEEGIIVIPH